MHVTFECEYVALQKYLISEYVLGIIQGANSWTERPFVQLLTYIDPQLLRKYCSFHILFPILVFGTLHPA